MGVHGTYIITSNIKDRAITQEKLNLSSPKSDIEASTHSEYQKIFLYSQEYEVDHAKDEMGFPVSAVLDNNIMLELSTSMLAVNPLIVRWKIPESENVFFQVKMEYVAPANSANNVYGIGLSDGTRNNRYYLSVCANGTSGGYSIGKIVNGVETVLTSTTATINKLYYYTHTFIWSKNNGKIITNRPGASDTAIIEITDNSLKNITHAEIFVNQNPTYGGYVKVVPPFQLLRY